MSSIQDNGQQEPTPEDLVVTFLEVAGSVATAEITANTHAWRGYRFRVDLDTESMELLAIEVRRDPDAAPLNSWRLQNVPISLINRAVLGEWIFRDVASGAGEGTIVSTSEIPQPDAGRRGDDLKLAQLARAYVETLGEPRQSALLAERFGYQPGSIAKLIHRARARDLLTRTTKGSPGGVLTPRALALLD